MPEFKKGDRVRHTEFPLEWPGVYTVQVDSNGKSSVTVQDDGGREHLLTADWLEPVPPYAPQVGDRVRVTYEGVVRYRSGDYLSLDNDSNLLPFAPKGNGVVEVLEKAPEPPKPFPVGTIVSTSVGSIVRVGDGEWVWAVDGLESITRDESVRSWLSSGAKVLYEPPTS